MSPGLLKELGAMLRNVEEVAVTLKFSDGSTQLREKQVQAPLLTVDSPSSCPALVSWD